MQDPAFGRWPVHGVPSHVAVAESGRRSERLGVKPLHGITGIGAENRLPRIVGPYRALAEHRAGVRGIAECRDRERETTLHLVKRG